MSGRLWSDHVEYGEQHIMETESVDRDGEKGAGIHSLSCEMVLGWEVGGWGRGWDRAVLPSSHRRMESEMTENTANLQGSHLT